MFKLGDEVVAVAAPDGNEVFKGRTGIIIDIDETEGEMLPYGVEFEGFGVGWWCEADSLELSVLDLENV